MKIDIFPHILPVKYKEALNEIGSPSSFWKQHFIARWEKSAPMVYDLDLRFQLMDKYDGLMQVLTLAAPPIEQMVSPAKAVDLAKLANDELAELVVKYPDRFAAAVACLPMNNIDAALKEVDRAIKELGLRGVQIYTPINDKPLDLPEFMPLYEKMSQYNLPIWIHPNRGADFADYKTLKKSMYQIQGTFGWPYDTTAAMTHLIFSGVFDKWPNIKFITHHAGGMVPYFAQRIACFYDIKKLSGTSLEGQTKAPIEYYKMFYNDTALYGHTPGLMCAYAFFGADHLLFGTDMPLGDPDHGFKITGQTISAIDQMDITEVEKKKILGENARSLLCLPVQ
ncbi:amidohydrolase family protein [Chloroflexota bacterium]